MTPEEYLRDRVEDQIVWYDRKSGSNKMWFIILQIATLVAAASVPVFAIFSSDMWARVTVAIPRIGYSHHYRDRFALPVPRALD
jgi:hypothetical protein